MAKAKIKNNPILTSRDLLNGYVAGKYDFNLYNMTPIQMVPEKEKDDDWKKWNLDWLERAAHMQLLKTSKRIIKNYNLANGLIDKLDYMISPENPYTSEVQILTEGIDQSFPIKFFPIIPNVINVLSGEFSKRDNRIIVKAIDDLSVSEAYEYKKQLLTDILVQRAQAKKQEQLTNMGIDLGTKDPNQQQQIQQEMDTAKQLAEAQVKFKSYRGIAEQWATGILEMDDARFFMQELEETGFRDSLIADREFWHIRLKEDDYEIELWEPWLTFYHKSPTTYYISQGNYVGRQRLMSIPDVIDVYGSRMTEEQIMSLKNQYKLMGSFPLVPDAYKGQESWYTNFTKPYPENYTNVTWQKYMDGQAATALSGKIPSNREIATSWADLANGKYEVDLQGPGMVRVTEVYWKSQKRVFELTWIKKDGTLVKEVVDENYKLTEDPIYDLSLSNVKSKDTLVQGEHLDPIWINEVREGVKINMMNASYYGSNYSEFEPVYLGGCPIKFQFKGTNNIYGCKLPVEGKIFSERGSSSSSLVDKMYPNQISFNIVNNQIIEFLADEIGNVLVIDPNSIPKNSLGGEWGKHNYQMFHQVMRDYQVAAVDNSVNNTGSVTNFQHFQQVDLTKTNQIVTRIKLAEYFKNEAFAVVGITPQRLGSVAASETATGTTQAINNSYSQTESYFDQHMNQLMPRVKQMQLDAAQFYNATKPISRINYMNQDEENILFDIEGDKILLRDFLVKAMSTADIKELKAKLDRIAEAIPNAGGSLADAARMIAIKSPAEIISKLEESEDKREQEAQTQRDHETQLQQQQQQFAQEQEDKMTQHDDYWKQQLMNKDIYIAQIKALGYAKDTDINSDSIPDVLETQKFLADQGINAQNQFIKQKELNLKQQKLTADQESQRQNILLKKEEMKSREKIEKMKLQNVVVGETPKKK